MTDTDTDIDIKEHYDRIDPVVEALAELDGAVTLGNDDFVGWYIKRNCRSDTALRDGYDREARPATLSHDWDTIKDRIDRVLYAITSYKPPGALIDWEPYTWDSEAEDTDWQTEKPMPEYADMAAVALWGDVDLNDRLKPMRGELDETSQEIIERTLASYAEAFAILYGSRDAVFALDSVGGAYVMGAPAATAPIAEHFADDRDARERVMAALVDRSNDWLEGAQTFVEAGIHGARHLIDPDWVNNKNRAYKAPLSLHKDHDAVVTPYDPFDPSYEMTPVSAVDDDLIAEATEWANAITDDSYRALAENIVAALWPRYVREHDDWRAALEAWVQDERRKESRPDPGDHDASTTSTSSDHRVTPSIDDVYAAIDNLDVEAVAEKTIVKSWTENASGKTDNSGSGKKAFIPIWGSMGDSGTANYIHEKGVWNDTGANDYGTVVEMALISEENWPRGKIADGEDWARGIAHLRDLGFDIPVWTPDASVSGFEEMPYWALKQAAFALGVCTEDDLIDDEDAGYKRFDADTYNAALEAVTDAGLEHGRDKVGRDSGSADSSAGWSKGSALFSIEIEEALAATHPEAEPGDEIDVLPEEDAVGTVEVREENGSIELYDSSINGGYWYIPLSWFAVLSGERSAAHPSGRFSDRELWGAWREAKERGALPFDDPVPLRARLHVAREHDLAPNRFIDAAEDDPKALPAAVYNNILEVIEEEYGLNPGLDDLEVDRKAEQRAEFLAGGGEDGGDADKDREIKRMLATLDEVSE